MPTKPNLLLTTYLTLVYSKQQADLAFCTFSLLLRWAWKLSVGEHGVNVRPWNWWT